MFKGKAATGKHCQYCMSIKEPIIDVAFEDGHSGEYCMKCFGKLVHNRQKVNGQANGASAAKPSATPATSVFKDT